MRRGRWRALLLAFLLLPGLVACWFFAGLIGAVIPAQNRDWPGEAVVEIRLAFTPIHTDILLPIDDALRARFAFADNAGVGILHPEARCLLVGWGARDYYTSQTAASACPPGPILRAITGDSSVIRLTEAGYAALLDRINAEIGQPELVMAPGLSAIDAFTLRKARSARCKPATAGWARRCARRACRLDPNPAGDGALAGGLRPVTALAAARLQARARSQ